MARVEALSAEGRRGSALVRRACPRPAEGAAHAFNRRTGAPGKVCDECLPAFERDRTDKLVTSAKASLSRMRPRKRIRLNQRRRVGSGSRRLARRASPREHGNVSTDPLGIRRSTSGMFSLDADDEYAPLGRTHWPLWVLPVETAKRSRSTTSPLLGVDSASWGRAGCSVRRPPPRLAPRRPGQISSR